MREIGMSKSVRKTMKTRFIAYTIQKKNFLFDGGKMQQIVFYHYSFKTEIV